MTTIAKNISKSAKQTSTRHRPVHTRGRTKQYMKQENISYIMFITASIMGSSTACRKPSWFWTSANIRNKRTKTAILIPNFLSSCRLLHCVRREAEINRSEFALEYQRLLFLVWRPLSRSCVIIWKGFVCWVYMPNMKYLPLSQSYSSKVIAKTSFCQTWQKLDAPKLQYGVVNRNIRQNRKCMYTIKHSLVTCSYNVPMTLNFCLKHQ